MSRGKPATGREIRSSVEAATEQAAIAALLNRNLLVVSIQEKIGKKGKTSGGKVALAGSRHLYPPTGHDDRCRSGDGPIAQGLAEQTTNKVMRDVIKDVCTRVEGGDSFSEALGETSQSFQPALCLHGGGRRKRRFAG